MKWVSAITTKISWNTLWKMEPIRLQFTTRCDDAKCGLCSEPGHLEHILSSCKTARFTWRHDTLLRILAHHLELKKVRANKSENKAARKEDLKFVKAGQTVNKTNETKYRDHSVGLLNRAQDWELRVDLDKRLVFPCEIETRLIPDIVMFSTAKKLLIMVEINSSMGIKNR